MQFYQWYLSLFLKNEIAEGPFKGMRYIKNSIGSVVLPKLLGTYEMELHHIWNDIKNKEYDFVFDVGAAEGYYAVGLARLLPKTTIVAFETFVKGRNMMKRIASLNHVQHQIEVQGKCTLLLLQTQLQKSVKPFILMDIEGYELELLNPEKVPELKGADILVEVHEGIDITIPAVLKQRFNESHSITAIPYNHSKKMPDVCNGNKILYKHRSVLVNEFRGSNTYWFMMESKQKRESLR